MGAQGEGTAIAVAAHDDRFQPSCVDLPAAGTVTIVVRNEGRHPHNLTIDAQRRVAVDAGQVGILEAEVLAGGVRFACTIHPGMDGELRVRP